MDGLQGLLVAKQKGYLEVIDCLQLRDPIFLVILALYVINLNNNKVFPSKICIFFPAFSVLCCGCARREGFGAGGHNCDRTVTVSFTKIAIAHQLHINSDINALNSDDVRVLFIFCFE